MGNEWEQLSQAGEHAAELARLLGDVIAALAKQKKSIHGEKTMAGAVLAGEETSVVLFEGGSQDESCLAFRERLAKKEIPFMALDFKKSGQCGVLFRKSDEDRVLEIIREMNARKKENGVKQKGQEEEKSRAGKERELYGP